VKIWKATWSPLPPFYLGDKVIRLVEKTKSGKTDPVEKQNISKVVWPITLDTTTNTDYTTGPRHINSGFGFREYGGQAKSHQGIDAPARSKSDPLKGCPVYAIMDGTVWYIDSAGRTWCALNCMDSTSKQSSCQGMLDGCPSVDGLNNHGKCISATLKIVTKFGALEGTVWDIRGTF